METKSVHELTEIEQHTTKRKLVHGRNQKENLKIPIIELKQTYQNL